MNEVEAGDTVEVRRNAGLSAVAGAVASAIAIAYLARATGTGSWLDWALVAVTGGLGVAHLLAFVDARTPLLVADTHGVRIRLGRTWHGMTWGALSRVEHLPRRNALRDGKLVLVPRDVDHELADLDRAARRQSRIAERLYGAPFAVPLALSTRVVGAGGDLTSALARMADDAASVEQVDGDPAPPRPSRWHDPRPTLALGIGAIATRLQQRSVEEAGGQQPMPATAGPPLVASATPSPLRDRVAATRVEVRHDLTIGATALKLDLDGSSTHHLPEDSELRRPGSVNLVEDTMLWGDRAQQIDLDTGLIELAAVEPAEDPIVGPEYAAARTRLGLSVDQLADRTRIRPHVIESIEVDDFAPCGGDFYARGHLRTLARVLGIEVAPLLASYDEHYADAPIDLRRVFEAELATGAHGSIRGTHGGPNWSILIAAVMTLVLAWSVARLIMDSPIELSQPAPALNGSAGPNGNTQKLGDPVPVVLTAAGGGARVVVRDGAGEVIFTGDLAFGESKTLEIAPPVRVQTSDGSLVASVDGEDRGALGTTGQPAQSSFIVP